MKLSGMLLLVWALLGKGVMAQPWCPVNTTRDTLEVLKAAPARYYGRVLACNGKITQVFKTERGMPYYQIELEGQGFIWVSAQVDCECEKAGTVVRVLGFFEKALAGYKPSGVHKDPYHLVGVAVLDMGTRQFNMQPGQEDIAQQWLDGKIPVAIRLRGVKD